MIAKVERPELPALPMLTPSESFELACLELVRIHGIVPDGCIPIRHAREQFVFWDGEQCVLTDAGNARATALRSRLRSG